MATVPKNNHKPWTNQEISKLKDLISHNTPTGLIANNLGRTENAIYSKVSDLDLSVKPVNKSPYNRRK